MIFGRAGDVIAVDQKEHEQIFPRPGWVEHNAVEIWQRTQEVIDGALAKSGLRRDQIAAVGIANQRETAVMWHRGTGTPIYNAIVWQDTRTDQIVNELARQAGQDRFRHKTGLPLATYFAGPKVRWILDNVPDARAAAQNGDIIFGTVDTFLIWWLTGGPHGGVHVTDVTNASRTMLMDLRTLDWDDELLDAIARAAGDATADTLLRARCTVRHPVHWRACRWRATWATSMRQLVGQTCYGVGEAKNTYGTGNFMLLNTGLDWCRPRAAC